MQKELLSPIRLVIEYAAEKNYVKLLCLLGNILIACAYEYEETSFECICAITSGKWPTKMICSRILHKAPLFKLKKEYLVTIFGHLYNLHNQPPLEYALLPEVERTAHRIEFVNYLINFPVPPEIMSNSAENAVEYQPVLPMFYQLASHASAGSQFQRLICQELFYLGFSTTVGSQIKQSQISDYLLDRFQTEVRYCLELLLSRTPELMSTFIYCIGQNLHVVDKKLLNYINENKSMFTNWNVDLYSINWIAHFVAQWKFPESKEKSLQGNQQLINQLIQNKLLSPPQGLRCSEHIAKWGIEIGSCIFSKINWNLVSPSNRIYCALILIGAKSYIQDTPTWSISQLFSNLGKQLIQPPLDDYFVHCILSIAPERAPHCYNEIIALQLLLALGIVTEQYKNNNNNTHMNDNQGHSWLLSYGFYDRVLILCRPDISCACNIISQFDVLKEEPTTAAPHLAKLIRTISSYNVNNINTFNLLQQSLILLLKSSPINESLDDKSKRYQLWINACLPVDRSDFIGSSLLDDLIAYAYCTGFSLEPFIVAIRNRNYSRNHIINFYNDGFGWIVLIILYSFQPIYPTSSRDKNAVLPILIEIAQDGNTNSSSIALWLHFFMLYFRANQETFISQSLRDQLSKHFIQTAKFFEEKNQSIYRLYYAFSTWKKAIIDASTGDYHEEQDINLLNDIYKTLPPRFHNKTFQNNTFIIQPIIHEPFQPKQFHPLANEKPKILYLLHYQKDP